MSTFERRICLVIFILQFLIIAYLRFSDFKTEKAPVDPYDPSAHQLYSFYGTNIEGKKKLIQFTAYSSANYIFCILSADCHHCHEFLTKFNTYFLNNKINRNIQLILLTESIADIGIDTSFSVLELDRDDLLQFGFNTPSIFAANGRGKILYSHKGYYPGIFKDLLNAFIPPEGSI